jgi:hypothetical protein
METQAGALNAALKDLRTCCAGFAIGVLLCLLQQHLLRHRPTHSMYAKAATVAEAALQVPSKIYLARSAVLIRTAVADVALLLCSSRIHGDTG